MALEYHRILDFPLWECCSAIPQNKCQFDNMTLLLVLRVSSIFCVLALRPHHEPDTDIPDPVLKPENQDLAERDNDMPSLIEDS
eukprot:s271_g6.t1